MSSTMTLQDTDTEPCGDETRCDCCGEMRAAVFPWSENTDLPGPDDGLICNECAEAVADPCHVCGNLTLFSGAADDPADPAWVCDACLVECDECGRWTSPAVATADDNDWICPRCMADPEPAA